jgi:hypothetical protein
MANGVYFVFSNPPAGVRETEYSDWYERHVGEIIAGPGFAGARRYWLSPAGGDRPPTIYRHLSLYELDGDSRTAMAELGRRMAAGQLALPDWFGQIRFASLHGVALEDADVHLPDHAYLVFSTPPPQIGFDAYDDWYTIHLRENLTADGFEAGWRFRLVADTVDPVVPCEATYAAIYEVSAELPALRRALVESRDDGRRITYPEWFGQISFASVDCLAITPYVAAAVRS